MLSTRLLLLLQVLYCSLRRFLSCTISELDVTLAGDMATSSGGTVKIYFEGEYHYICDKVLDNAIANVICRQMYFPSGQKTSGSFGALEGVTVMYRPLLCTGYESSLKECTIDESRIVYEHECSYAYHGEVDCDWPDSGTSYVGPLVVST